MSFRHSSLIISQVFIAVSFIADSDDFFPLIFFAGIWFLHYILMTLFDIYSADREWRNHQKIINEMMTKSKELARQSKRRKR